VFWVLSFGMKSEKIVYLDNAATTAVDSDVVSAMFPFFGDNFGNPGSFHSVGKRALDALSEARGVVAGFLNCRDDEVLFTGGGTEADNLAILGYARAHAKFGKHLVTTSLEHHAVLEVMQFLVAKEGFELTIVDVSKDGVVLADDVLAAVREDTILVSVMYVNNEIGTVQPVEEIGRGLEKMRKSGSAAHLAFHVDAMQAAGYLECDVLKIHADLLSLNGSKLYGPRGVGALFVRRGVKLQPLMFGGSQERGLRPGTENVAAIVGFARALELVMERRGAECERLISLRNRLIDGLLEIPKTRLNGSVENRICNNVNVSIMDVEGEALLLYLDSFGIMASSGSACTSASLDPSHVILALGVPFEAAHGSIRFSLGRDTAQEDIDYVIEVMPGIVEKLRAFSPVNVDPKYYE